MNESGNIYFAFGMMFGATLQYLGILLIGYYYRKKTHKKIDTMFKARR